MGQPSDYITGTITLTNGSAAFTGSGTGWLAAQFREGDIILDIAGADGRVLVIDDIASNTAGTLTRPWSGATLTNVAYRMRYQWDAGRVSAQARGLIEQLGNGNIQALAALIGPGVPAFDGPHSMVVRPITDFINGVRYDVQVDTLPDRAAYNGQSAGFAVLVSNVGDGRSAVYSKASNTSGDWTDPAYVTGPISTVPGPPGVVPRGAYDGATVYAIDDLVTFNKSTFRKKTNAGAGNAPSSASPPVDNANWEVFAAKGQDGSGTGDVVGPSGATDGRLAAFIGPSGKLIGEGPSIADLAPVFGPRLTLTQGVAVTSADVVGATHIYVEPSVLGADIISIPDGTERKVYRYSSIDIALTTARNLAGSGYDVWMGFSGGSVVAGTGPAWANANVGTSSRGTGAGTTEIEFWKGMWVNKNSITIWNGTNSYTLAARCAVLVGSFRTVLAGEAEDSVLNRLVSSVYSPAFRTLQRNDPTASWIYSTQSWRQANNSVANQVSIFQCLAGREMEIEALGTFSNSSATYQLCNVGIGKNSVSLNSAQLLQTAAATLSFFGTTRAIFREISDLGFTGYAWLEQGAGADAQTWRGTLSPVVKSGLSGRVLQ